MSGNKDQCEFWTDEAGPIWVEQRAAMDAMFAPILGGTLNRAELKAGQSVLDVGCGAGTSTLAVADRIGSSGHVTGIDISCTLLEAAKITAYGKTNITFVDGDAQSHSFAPQSKDAIVSRFGVMFFDDSVAAFKNMASSLRLKGIISFSAWGAIVDNPFFTLPAQTARRILGPVPRSDPDAPGPFAFRNPDNVKVMMDAAGLEAQIEVVEEKLTYSQDPLALAQTMCLIGPAQSALSYHSVNAEMRDILVTELAESLSVYQTGKGVSIPAQINYITARKAT